VAINLGDAILTFLADTTMLDAAYDKVGSEAAGKLKPAADAAKGVGDSFKGAGEEGVKAGVQVSESWIKVARATQENSAAQKELQTSLAAVKTTGGEDVVAMLALAAAQQRAAVSAVELAIAQKEATSALNANQPSLNQAKETLGSIGEITGVGIPRGIRGFVAELPGASKALSAAFSGFALIMIVQILGEAISKLVEMADAGEKMRQDWVRTEGDFLHASQSIQDQIDQQQEKFIELTKGPVAAYEFALKHLRSTAEDTLSGISGELDKNADKFAEHGGFFASIFGIEEGTLHAKKMADELHIFSADLQETMRKAEAAKPFSGYDAGLAAVQERMKQLNEELEKEKALEAAGPDVGPVDTVSLTKALEILRLINGELEKGKQLDSDRDAALQQDKKDKALQHEIEIGSARVNVRREFAMASLAVDAQEALMRLQQGKETTEQFIQDQKDEADRRYRIELDAASARAALLSKDPIKNEAAIIEANGKIRELQAEHQLELLKIDEDGYTRRAQIALRAMEKIVSGTRQGSQERIDEEQHIADFLKATYGEESDAYLQQLNKIADAERAFKEEKKKIRAEDARAEQALADDKAQANVNLAQYLQSQMRISMARLNEIQREAEEDSYERKKTALDKQLKALGPEEVLARKKVIHDLELLEQQHEETKALNAAKDQDRLELQYQVLGVKSAEMYRRELKIAKEAYGEIEASGVATYGEILQAQIRVLEATIEVDAAQGKNVTKERAALDKLVTSYNHLGLALGKVVVQGKLADKVLAGLGVDAKLMGGTIQNVALGATAALGQMFQAWAAGGLTVAQACEKITAAVLQSIAQYAFAQAIVEMAKGFAALPPTSPDFGHAHEHFTSAALWFVAGAAASAAGGAISGMSNNTGSAGASGLEGGVIGEPSSGGAAGQAAPPEQEPVNVVNVQRFAAGGLVSRPTLSVLGDSMSGGSQVEAALPLEDPSAMQTVGEAIGPYVNGGGGNTYNIDVHVEGMISPDNLTRVIRQINQKVLREGGNLVSSNALRVTQRS
jgi:hypothetical protein